MRKRGHNSFVLKPYAGPDPADVEWDYLNLSGLESSLRTLLSFSILMPIAILLSFTIPIATQVADISNVFFRQIQP